MSIPEFNEIIEPNDQTEARREHLDKLRDVIGNAYPNKYERSNVTGAEDTISNVVNFAPIIEIVKELKDNTPENEKPDQELKAALNEKLKQFGNVRISGRLAVPPRVMGKAAFVHLSDGVERLQIYVRRDDVRGVYNGSTPTPASASVSEPPASAGGLNVSDSNANENPSANADGSDTASVSGWELFKLLDHGDFIGAEGFLFLTNTGELSVHVETLQFLSKALVPMPDKMHGIADPELQRRYRYADLIASSLQIEHEELTTREVFERRAKLISGMRRYLDDHDFIEVETPMLTPKATGAAAKPFATYHNALDIPLYARIAPELYLKRLTVGGFEKVYELNRNFRNEGLSQRHNPEFTMLEFYCAYMDVNGMMDFSEAMIRESVQKATGGSLQVKYGENEIDFSKFERLSMNDAINNSPKQKLQKLEKMAERNAYPTLNYTQVLVGNSEFPFTGDWLGDVKVTSTFIKLANKMQKSFAIEVSKDKEIKIYKVDDNSKIGQEMKGAKVLCEGTRESISLNKRIEIYNDVAKQMLQEIDTNNFDESAEARNVVEIFELLVEENLIQPTFIIDYPKSISPLSKASPANPQIAERFELFINGMECANGFSELNDPQEQYERFRDQMNERESGDEEAMVLDEDYIRALAYGMPPAAGIGIGIDRLVMLLTNKHSIRDVILFPHMRPERKHEETAETDTPPVNPS